MTLLMIVELLVVLVALWIGARYGSLALGAISGIGLAILVFGFQLKPGDPPTDVIYIIIAAVTCAGILQASGGMDWMIQIAEKLLRKHPDRITILAPLTTFFLTILVGTGHVVYTLMPIICDIALKKGIRPERPCSVASIASQIGITCSPIAAAVVAFSAISADNGFQVSNIQIIMVSIPACIIGILAAVGYSWKRGLDLDKDPAFQAKLNNPEQREYIYGSTATTLDKEISKESKRAVYIFMGALAVIVAISLTSMFGLNVLPEYSNVKAAHHATSLSVTPTTRDTICVRSFVFDNGKEVYLETAQAEQEALAKGMTIEHNSDTIKVATNAKAVDIDVKKLIKSGVIVEGVTEKGTKPLTMNIVIQIIMLVACALMIIFCKAKPKAAIAGPVWQNGMVAVVAIYGIAWMSNTYFDNYQTEMQLLLGEIVHQYPWSIAIAFFAVSVLINSQGAVVVSMLPLAYALGIPGWILLGVMPSVYGYFFIPNYPSDIATVNFDRSGTTVIGKYLLNHSFMMPGLIHVVVATITGFAISYAYHFWFGMY